MQCDIFFVLDIKDVHVYMRIPVKSCPEGDLYLAFKNSLTQENLPVSTVRESCVLAGWKLSQLRTHYTYVNIINSSCMPLTTQMCKSSITYSILYQN